jgi:hypothetical protein
VIQNGNGNQSNNGTRLHAYDAGRVTYAEVRRMANWLEVFAASDLADALRVPIELGDDFITAMLWHGIIEDTDDFVDGELGIETVYQMVKVAADPKEHWTDTPPEIQAVLDMYGGFELFNNRGMPVRIRSERDMRKTLSTPGARQIHKERERRYLAMEEAKRKRAEEDRKKSQKDPKWKRKGKGNTVAV